MAPRSRLLDLERHDDGDALFFFYGAYDQSHSDGAVAMTHAILFWPVYLAAVLLLHLAAPFPHAAAAAGTALLGAYCCSLLGSRAGALAALLCWAASAALAPRLDRSLGA